MVTAGVSAEQAEHVSTSCLNRMGRPEEIADVAVFLSSESASFVTGTTWQVDGGYTAMQSCSQSCRTKAT